MNKNILQVIQHIADEYRIKPFIKREILYELLKNQLNGEYVPEIKLLIRLSKAGYITSLAKSKNINNEKERIIKCLYEDESIDEKIASEIVDLLSAAIIYAWERETIYNEELQRQFVIKENKEKDLFLNKMTKVLEVSLKKIIKSYGIEILDDYNFCRAILKDMAQGNFIEEITLISLLLENKLHKEIVKFRLFKIKPNDLISKLSDKFAGIHNFGIDTKMIIALIINVINSEQNSIKSGGIKNWTKNLFKFSEK